MDKREEEQLKLMIGPMADIVRDSFIKALVLRCNVHQQLAIQNGAEPEDYGPLIAHAIDSAQPITNKWLNEIAEMKRARQFGERNDQEK